jgi:2-amino-4-hydroxy-6-hydroxymethyldihydropteridine diphosphokinase
MNDVFLLIGGNMGDRQHYLQTACTLIDKNTGSIVAKSSLYETAAWGITEQSPFLNQVLRIETDLTPAQLLENILKIEEELGRKRLVKMGPRIIDIDILFYGDHVLSTPALTIPHPQIQYRRFVLTPLDELIPDYVHPVLKRTVGELLKECQDRLEVTVYDATKQ